MTADGKALEALVAFVEENLLPPGFDVQTNQQVRNEDGHIVAEFDVQIRGKVGSTEIAWLIECRDRPSDGPQSGAWIEQLVGRRQRFNFNKVTAVSTTGFASGARDYAKQTGIELHEVKALTPEHFSEWLQIAAMNQQETRHDLGGAHIIVGEDESVERQEAVKRALGIGIVDMRLVNSKTGERLEMRHAFRNAVQGYPGFFEGIEPNGPKRSVTFRARYVNDDDHFLIETDLGPVRVREIIWIGELSIIERLIPLAVTAKYGNVEGDGPISEYAAFEPFDADGAQITLEMHRVADTGLTHVVVRTEKK